MSEPTTQPSPSVLLKLVRWLLASLGGCCRIFVIAWGFLAVYYSPIPWLWLRIAMAGMFLGIGVWALWRIQSARHGFSAFAVIFIGVLALWSFKQPSHERDWAPDVAIMPRAIIDGDRVTLTGVRNFDYRDKTHFTERWETREVQLSHLTGVDFFVSYWSKPGMMGHTFVSFIFDNAPPVCISIEARKEKGEPYAAIASMFKQYELVYVVGEERDIAGVRTHHRNESVFCYPLRVKPEGARRLFLDYLRSINELADKPVFYHLLSNNCTNNIKRHAAQEGRRSPFFWRVLLNGYADSLIYDLGGMDTSLPFAELKARSLINPAAMTGSLDEGFSERIRVNLPSPAMK